ncbi:MAG: 16S rRNA (cytidine(1402)-2'-O)-methyltransferase [Candidatus Pacebacteria bacterium]|nr:16S rRNA (cytidine(1402)-2'-O)-methyltransferase [Candidatus Paceibacterota bacterium]
MSTLYIVATPIGNLEDITFRAVRILGEVDLILCEDTRQTRKLLNHYSVQTPTMSYHSQSSLSKVDVIIKMLAEGKNLALVSDAGTPTISDPGVLLVSEVKKALGDKILAGEISIMPIPGPNAAIATLSASGLPSSDFLFLGFLPHKKGRETLFKEIGASERTVVFYESPHRIMKTLASLGEHCASDQIVVIGRELTKMFEEIITGSPAELATYFESNPDKCRGEMVVAVGRLLGKKSRASDF